MEGYWFKWRRPWMPWWRKAKVTGHKWIQDQDKMLLHFQGGAVREIASWQTCECRLGVDWVIYRGKQIKEENESG